MIIRILDPYLSNAYQGKIFTNNLPYTYPDLQDFVKTVLILEAMRGISDIHQFEGLHCYELRIKGTKRHTIKMNHKYRIILKFEKDKKSTEDILVIENLYNIY